jgi:DNA mismatch repair ATPase MutS
VLALAGAPVRAEKFQLTPLSLGASIQTIDSLAEGRSRFYTEILRLKQIVEMSKAGPPVFFLLDELLAGTNSHDRKIGAAGILCGLLDSGAVGLVTTHDLSLTQLEDQRVRNMHFEDHLENGVLRFDYKMRPGVVAKSNALELMRAVGLEV